MGAFPETCPSLGRQQSSGFNGFEALRVMNAFIPASSIANLRELADAVFAGMEKPLLQNDDVQAVRSLGTAERRANWTNPAKSTVKNTSTMLVSTTVSNAATKFSSRPI